MAIWDAVAKIEGKPLYRLLVGRYRCSAADERVWVYAAGGYLQDEMRWGTIEILFFDSHL
jgi:L-alanine-DL-glutamate epimerase-like enolase superfamily enzyme